MLCDIALKTLERTAEVTRRRLVKSVKPTDSLETEAGLDTIIRAIRAGDRFILSPLFVETAEQLAEPRSVDRSRDYLFTPADITWIEWEGDAPGGNPRSQRHAFLLIGAGAGSDATRETIRLGWGAYFALNSDGDPFPLIFFYDFPGAAQPILRWQQSPLVALRDFPDGAAVAAALDSRRLGTFLGAILALLNTPRLAHVIDHDHAQLNRARMRLKRPPILSYKDVRITIDRGDLGIGQQISETGGRALHHVRAFLRIQRGRVQLVRPHWRGNPRFGVIKHRYVALRAEDEPGAWQGGPLPGPAVIHALADDQSDEDQ